MSWKAHDLKSKSPGGGPFGGGSGKLKKGEAELTEIQYPPVTRALSRRKWGTGALRRLSLVPSSFLTP